MSARLNDDDLDEKIAGILQQDARVSNRQIARNLGVSEGFVRKRLKRLLDTGELRLGVLVSGEAAGLRCNALVRFGVAPQAVSAVAAHLAEIAEVRFVGIAVGRFDVYGVMQTSDRDTMFRLLGEGIARLPGVTFVDVREIMVVIKNERTHIRIT
jgi:Lrp/AsnC family transcriptional regulator for asnA, asnC and gidA